MTEIDGYKVVSLRTSSSAVNCHSIYMKEHFIRLMDPSKPKGRTLFLLNVPPYVTEKSLEQFFSRNGTVLYVTFAEKPGKDETYKWLESANKFVNKEPPFKFKVAYIIYKTSNSVQRALQEVNTIDLYNETTGESIIDSGIQLWHSQYQQKFLDVEKTQKYIDEFMLAYDEKERIAQEAAKSSEADADGWVTVGKQGKNSGFEQKDGVIEKLEKKIKRGKKELSNFYTFQIRESKMKNIIELRKKFEDDKRKIDTLKQTRRFRPF